MAGVYELINFCYEGEMEQGGCLVFEETSLEVDIVKLAPGEEEVFEKTKEKPLVSQTRHSSSCYNFCIPFNSVYETM